MASTIDSAHQGQSSRNTSPTAVSVPASVKKHVFRNSHIGLTRLAQSGERCAKRASKRYTRPVAHVSSEISSVIRYPSLNLPVTGTSNETKNW